MKKVLIKLITVFAALSLAISVAAEPAVVTEAARLSKTHTRKGKVRHEKSGKSKKTKHSTAKKKKIKKKRAPAKKRKKAVKHKSKKKAPKKSKKKPSRKLPSLTDSTGYSQLISWIGAGVLGGFGAAAIRSALVALAQNVWAFIVTNIGRIVLAPSLQFKCNTLATRPKRP